VPSNGDVRSGGNTSTSAAVATMPTPEMTVSPAVLADIDIKSRAKVFIMNKQSDKFPNKFIFIL
jgi:hypothetical protein